MVVMTDFLSALPLGPLKYRRLLAQIILTVLCIVLCLLKDPKFVFAFLLISRMLVAVSSLGLFAIAGGFIALIM